MCDSRSCSPNMFPAKFRKRPLLTWRRGEGTVPLPGIALPPLSGDALAPSPAPPAGSPAASIQGSGFRVKVPTLAFILNCGAGDTSTCCSVCQRRKFTVLLMLFEAFRNFPTGTTGQSHGQIDAGLTFSSCQLKSMHWATA